jgi:hypothetical protein
MNDAVVVWGNSKARYVDAVAERCEAYEREVLPAAHKERNAPPSSGVAGRFGGGFS